MSTCSPTASQASASLDGDLLYDSPRNSPRTGDINGNNNSHSNRSGDTDTTADGSRELSDECSRGGDSKSTDQTSLVSSSFTLNRSAASTYTAATNDTSVRSADGNLGSLPAELGLRTTNSQGSSKSGMNTGEEDFRPHPVQPLRTKEKSIYISSLPSIRGSTVSTAGEMTGEGGTAGLNPEGGTSSLNLDGSMTLPEVFQTSAADLGIKGEDIKGGADDPKIKGGSKNRSDASMDTEAAANPQRDLGSTSSLATADIGDSHGSSNLKGNNSASSNLNDKSISINNLENSQVDNNNNNSNGNGEPTRRPSGSGGIRVTKETMGGNHGSSSQMSGHNSSSSVDSGSESQNRRSRSRSGGGLKPRSDRRHGHHASTSSEASEAWMDVSFSSTSMFDKALVTSFEDMLHSSTDRGTEGLGGQTSLLSNVRRGLASIPSVRNMEKSNRTDFNSSGYSNNFNNSEFSVVSNGNSLGAARVGGAAAFNLRRHDSSGAGSGNASTRSNRSKESLAVSDIRDDDDLSDASPVIPVFKTMRGTASQPAVVHVDGGGDARIKGGENGNNGGGGGESGGGSGNWGVFQAIRTIGRRGSQGSASQGSSSVTGPSDGSAGARDGTAARPRHLNDGSQQGRPRRQSSRRRSTEGSQQSADTLTGFQVLQSTKQTSASTLGEGEARPPPPPRRPSDRRPSDRSRGGGGGGGGGGPRRRPRRLTVESDGPPTGSLSPPQRYQPASLQPRQSSSGDLARRTGGLNDSTVTMVTSNVDPRSGGAGLGGEDGGFGQIQPGVKSRLLMPGEFRPCLFGIGKPIRISPPARPF